MVLFRANIKSRLPLINTHLSINMNPDVKSRYYGVHVVVRFQTIPIWV